MTTREKGITMNNTLVPNALYTFRGRVAIAIDENRLTYLTDPDVEPQEKGDRETHTIALPGTEEWVSRMVSIRTQMSRELETLKSAARTQAAHLQGLREAILQKAVENDWCSEYDEFADEWDLIRRVNEFQVTVTVNLMARDSDAAREMVEQWVVTNREDDLISVCYDVNEVGY